MVIVFYLGGHIDKGVGGGSSLLLRGPGAHAVCQRALGRVALAVAVEGYHRQAPWWAAPVRVVAALDPQQAPVGVALA